MSLRLSRLLWRLLLLAVGAYGALCALLFVLQRQLLYHPDTHDIGAQAQRVPGATLQQLLTPDGETLNSWWVSPTRPGAPVYLYLHGNARNLVDRAERLGLLVAEGEGLLALSWRGYGGSSGSPSEAGLRLDAHTAYGWLSQRVDPADIIIFGESLGTGPAVELAATVPSRALVLDSPYSSIAAVAYEQYPWLPVNWLLRDRFDSLALAPHVRVPALVWHCRNDRVVPYASGQALFAELGSTHKELLTIEGRCHVPDITPRLDALRALERLAL
ncbi:MAG TPA: alpha/beta hydrolase [Hyphomicrobiales bacterium]|nr:alpha/beta hydrolase [Hyphomicrobiales bacterium]